MRNSTAGSIAGRALLIMKRHQPRRIQLRNAQRTIPLNTPALRLFAQVALDLTWPRRRAGCDIIATSVVFVLIVDDKQMAELHEQFRGMPGPTDVLTFHHGEIVISAQTAARQARRFRSSLDRELRLYLLHGLLHLCGYDDSNPRARARMQRLQRSLLRSALRRQHRAGV
jgi:probable rRNA maturation factor